MQSTPPTLFSDEIKETCVCGSKDSETLIYEAFWGEKMKIYLTSSITRIPQRTKLSTASKAKLWDDWQGWEERKRRKRKLSGEARLEAQTASSHHISKKTADRDYKVRRIDVAEMRGVE